MKFQSNFTYLKTEQMKKKTDGSNFLVVHVLDDNNNPCRFFVFDANTMNKIISGNIAGLQEVMITFTLSCSTNGWNVRLDDIDW